MPRVIIGRHRLKYAIIRISVASDGQENEDILKPAGFEVVVNRPLARDMKVMDKYEDRPITGSMVMLAGISNLDAEEIDLLDAEDMGALGNLLSVENTTGLKTGLSA